MAAKVASLAWMLAMSQRRIHACPSLPGLSTPSNVAVSCTSVVVVAQSFSDLTWWVRYDLHEHVQRATVHAEGGSERRGLPRVALQLSLLHAAAAPSNVMHWEETARGLVDVHDAVCADSVHVHEPAQLDEEPVRVGLLQSRAVELLQALGGLLEAQARATQKSLDPFLAGTHVESLCVEPFEHQASDRHRIEAQDVGHLHDVLAKPCHVCGRQQSSPAARLCSCRTPFPAVGSVRVDPVEHPGAQTLDLAQAPLHVPSPLSPPLAQHVEEPVAGDGVDVDLAALRPTAAGLVFNECSGWSCWRGCAGTQESWCGRAPRV